MSAIAKEKVFVNPSKAASMIGCHYRTVTKYIRRGVFTAHRPLGTGSGKPIRLLRAEVEAFIAGKEPAVKAMRNKPAKKAK